MMGSWEGDRYGRKSKIGRKKGREGNDKRRV